MSRRRSLARERTVQALYQWALTGQDPADIDVQFLGERDMEGVDVALFRELLREVTRRVKELDDLFGAFLDRPPAQLDPVERSLLRLGTYELKYRPEVPYRVAINEAVELAKSFGASGGHKYINSILDKVAKEARRTEIGGQAVR